MGRAYVSPKSRNVRYTCNRGNGQQAGRADLGGDRPLRGRLGRRHAAHRYAVHCRGGPARQRHLDAAGLPGRDSSARRLPAGRVRLPAPLRRPRHPHAGGRAERARRDEPGGAEDEHRRPAQGRDADRRRRRVHRPEPPEGRIRAEPARGRLARRVPGSSRPAHVADGRCAEGRRGRHAARGRAVEEHVRARADVVALRTFDRADDRVPGLEVRRRSGRRSRRRTSRRSTRVTPSARRRSRSPSPTRSSPRSSDRGRTGTSPETRRSRSASSPPRGFPGCRSSSARTRSLRRARSSRSSRATSSSVSGPSRRRTRSRPRAPRSAPLSAALSASRPPPARESCSRPRRSASRSSSSCRS